MSKIQSVQFACLQNTVCVSSDTYRFLYRFIQFFIACESFCREVSVTHSSSLRNCTVRASSAGFTGCRPSILLKFLLCTMVQYHALCINKCFLVFAAQRRFRSACTQPKNTHHPTYHLRALISSGFKDRSLLHAKHNKFDSYTYLIILNTLKTY